MVKAREKGEAIKLRKKGFSYNEILKQIPVAKSTLSLWLRNVGLAKRQRQRLTRKKLAGAKRGWEARQRKRILVTEKIKKKARIEVKKISERDLWMIGTALYWGEGAKERSRGTTVRLGNSDPFLIRVFLIWLRDICKIPREDIYFWIYLHETAKNRTREVQKYWARITNFPIDNFQRIVWKKNKIRTNRKNIGKKYYGLIRVSVKKSTNLNRKIQGWIEGVSKYCGVV